MPVDCQRNTCGGKGNLGMFHDRSSHICAAGLPTQQPDDTVGKVLPQYLLKDEVDALICDVILPDEQPRPLPPLRHPPPRDTRFAGKYGDVSQLINPPSKTKFELLVDELKNTVYSSYWKKPLGTVSDIKPNVPEGFDINQTYGSKSPNEENLYDIIMPKKPYPDKTPESEKPGEQKKFTYSEPFNRYLTYGRRSGIDERGFHAKCALTDERVEQGTAGRVVINTAQSNFLDMNQPRIGTVLAPHDNISNVPKGYSFGKLNPPDLPAVFAHYPLNPHRHLFFKCLKHLNYLRKCLSKRILPTAFHDFYLKLKYIDVHKSGWLPKKIVYDNCAKISMTFEPSLIEPLLSMLQAFDGSRIEYKSFVHLINYREPLPDMPKVLDFPPESLDFRTTYSEMIKPVQEPDNNHVAGLPSGMCLETARFRCLADPTCSSPEESDMKSCLNPSVMTLFQVNEQHMYAVREPEVVRRVFEASGETFTNKSFDGVWKKAQKFHPQGLVCYETFRHALEGNAKVD